jgi:arginyl-tRNA synthetase
MSTGKTEEEAKKQAPIILEAQEMLQNGGWMKQLNHFGKNEPMVYDGFAYYKNLGVDFDKYY